ncbi:MAG: YraN family protein [Huintestinicola sp.]
MLQNQSNDTSYNTGRIGEELTAYYLTKAGYEILRRNFRIRGGEIDIIASKDDIIAFVEVKTRNTSAIASGSEAVGRRKRRLVIRAAQEYLYRSGCGLQPRFDVSEVIVREGRPVKLRYYDNAYQAPNDEFIL